MPKPTLIRRGESVGQKKRRNTMKKLTKNHVTQAPMSMGQETIPRDRND